MNDDDDDDDDDDDNDEDDDKDNDETYRVKKSKLKFPWRWLIAKENVCFFCLENKKAVYSFSFNLHSISDLFRLLSI